MLSLGHQFLVSTLCCLCPFFKLVSGRSSPLYARAVWSTGSPSSSGFAYQETLGSPKFPGYPLELMPCSSTPVVSYTLALSCLGLLPSVSMRTSAFPSKKKTDGYPLLSTIIQISRLYHTACFLAPLGFRLPLPGLPARFTTALLARLLAGGTFTHWVTLTYFYRLQRLFPNVLSFSWRDNFFVRRQFCL